MPPKKASARFRLYSLLFERGSSSLASSKCCFFLSVETKSRSETLLKQQLSGSFNGVLTTIWGRFSPSTDCIRERRRGLIHAQGQIFVHSTATHRRRIYGRRLGLLAAAILILGIASGTSFITFGGTDIADAAIARVKSVLELINQRSPGRRLHAHLIKTKHRHKIAFRPHERALPKIRPELPFPPFDNAPALVDLVAVPPQSLPVAFNDVPLGPFGQRFPQGSFQPSPPTLIVPPGQSPPSSPRTVTPPVPAVPEPGSWILMMIGFALTAVRVRRRPGSERLSTRNS